MVINSEVGRLVAHAVLVGLGGSRGLIAVHLIKPQDKLFPVRQSHREDVTIGPLGRDEATIFEFLQLLTEGVSGDEE
jgi:hypothetical protein